MTSRTPRTVDDRLPNCSPDPFVPVAIAPEMVCASTSPWLASDSPASHSGAPTLARPVPARTLARPVSGFALVTPCNLRDVQQGVVGLHDGGEGVAAAGYADTVPLSRRRADGTDDVVVCGGDHRFGVVEALVAAPVLPVMAGIGRQSLVGQEVSVYTPQDLARAEKLLNTRPRNILNWQTPELVFARGLS